MTRDEHDALCEVEAKEFFVWLEGFVDGHGPNILRNSQPDCEESLSQEVTDRDGRRMDESKRFDELKAMIRRDVTLELCDDLGVDSATRERWLSQDKTVYEMLAEWERKSEIAANDGD